MVIDGSRIPSCMFSYKDCDCGSFLECVIYMCGPASLKLMLEHGLNKRILTSVHIDLASA